MVLKSGKETKVYTSTKSKHDIEKLCEKVSRASVKEFKIFFGDKKR